MSTYATSEAALLSVVRLLGTFTATNSSRANFSVLDAQAVSQAAVIVQVRSSENGDDLGNGRGSHGKRQQRHWMAIVVLQARGQTDDGASYTTLTTLTDTLVAHLDKYQRLNNAANVKRAQVREITEPRVRRDSAWLFQTILVEVLTETEPVITGGDYAR